MTDLEAVEKRIWALLEQVVSDAGSSMMGRPTVTRVIGTFWALLGAFLTFKACA